jgi:hypothetical protein
MVYIPLRPVAERDWRESFARRAWLLYGIYGGLVLLHEPLRSVNPDALALYYNSMRTSHPAAPAGTVSCATGTGVITRGLFNQTFCELCPPGTYSSGGFSAPCRVCTASTPPSTRKTYRPNPLWYKLPAGAKTKRYSDFHPRRKNAVRICGRCEAGFGLYGQPPVCTACPRDTYSPGKVQGPCFTCPVGGGTTGIGARSRGECFAGEWCASLHYCNTTNWQRE